MPNIFDHAAHFVSYEIWETNPAEEFAFYQRVEQETGSSFDDVRDEWNYQNETGIHEGEYMENNTTLMGFQTKTAVTENQVCIYTYPVVGLGMIRLAPWVSCWRRPALPPPPPDPNNIVPPGDFEQGFSDELGLYDFQYTIVDTIQQSITYKLYWDASEGSTVYTNIGSQRPGNVLPVTKGFRLRCKPLRWGLKSQGYSRGGRNGSICSFRTGFYYFDYRDGSGYEWRLLLPHDQSAQYQELEGSSDINCGNFGQGFTSSCIIHSYVIILNFRIVRPENQPEFPDPPGDNNMNCCREQRQDLDELMKKIDRLMKWTGATPGQMKLPKSLMDKSPGSEWLDNLVDDISPDEQETINSIPELYRWHIERIQEYFGQWPMTAKDEQGNEAIYPNLAIALSSLQTQIFIDKKTQALQMIASCKMLLEIGLVRQNMAMCISICDAIQSWLGVDTDEALIDMKFSFEFPRDQQVDSSEIDETQEQEDFLQNSTHKVKIQRLDLSKKIDNKRLQNFGDTAFRIIKILDILKMVHGVPISDENPEEDIKKYLKQYLAFSSGKTPEEVAASASRSEDNSAWAERVEAAFSADENP